MRLLSNAELEHVSGGNNTPPTCTTYQVTKNGQTVTYTVCQCPAGTEPVVTSSGQTTKVECKT